MMALKLIVVGKQTRFRRQLWRLCESEGRLKIFATFRAFKCVQIDPSSSHLLWCHWIMLL